MTKKLQILRGTTAQNDAYTGSVGELTMDTEKVEVRIHDGTTQGGKIIGSSGGSVPDRYVESINGWTGNVFLGAHEIGTYTSDEIDEKIAEAPASFPILFHTWSDCLMNNQSWLRADAFSWHSGDVYKSVYDHLVDDWNNATSVSETVNGHTFNVMVAEDGHKLFSINGHDLAQTLYDETGVAWYYILDTENKRFKLPRTKYGFTGLRDEVGNYVPESLPTHTHTRGSMNITGDIGWGINTLGDPHAGGAFTVNNSAKNAWNLPNDDNSWYVDFGFDASRTWTGSTSEPDNSVYGSGKPVQQRATQMYLYFYAGNFEQSATEQTAGLNAELFNGKADRDLNNLPSNYDYIVATQEATSANGYTWFRKYKSGWVEQGGRINLNGGISATNKLVTFPIVMKDNLYYANVSQDANAGPQLVMHGWQSATGMTIGTSNVSATGFVEWIVSGMSA